MRLEDGLKYRKFVVAAEWLAAGLKVQYSYEGGPWTDYHESKHSFSEYAANVYKFRVKPEKKYRPWKPEEVPHDAILRHESFYNNCWSKILGVGKNNVDIPTGDSSINPTFECISYEILLSEWKYSTDNGS